MFLLGKNSSQYKPRNGKEKLHECAPPLPLPFRNPSRCTMLGSCNGVVCLYDLQGKRIILWNPYIQRSITLPKPYCIYQDDDDSFFGLGFVDEISDYKVLLINQTNEAQIYSVQHNCWKIIANPAPLSTPIDHPDCVRGSLYWIYSKQGKTVLGVFDLKPSSTTSKKSKAGESSRAGKRRKTSRAG